MLDPATRVELVRRLEGAGATRIETVSFARSDRVPQMAGAEDVCAALADRRFSAIGLVLNAKGLQRAMECDLDEVNLVGYASNGYAVRNTGATAEQRNDEVRSLVAAAGEAGLAVSVTISVAFGDPVDGPVDPDHVADLSAEFVRAGAHEIALGDTIGVAVPSQVATTIVRVREAGAAALRCHFHNTRNTGYANVFAAIDAGVDAIDTSVGGYGGSPFSPGAGGNVATEDVVWALERSGLATGLDHAAVVATAQWLAERLGDETPPSMGARTAVWPPG